MIRKVVFVVHRVMYYRYYISLIEEGVRSGYDVELWHDISQPTDGIKGYSHPVLEIADSFTFSDKLTTKPFSGTEELCAKVNALLPHDILFSLRLPHFYWADKQYVPPCEWVVLQHGLDSFHEMLALKPYLPKPVKFMAITEDWIDKGREFLRTYSDDRSDAIVKDLDIRVVGQPEFDSFSYVCDEQSVRDKYGIPSGKKILLYLPFPYQNWNPKSAWERAFTGLEMNTALSDSGEWIHGRKMNIFSRLLVNAKDLLRILFDRVALACLCRRETEGNVFAALSAYAKKNDLLLVVKPRLKFRTSSRVVKQADVVLFDDEKQNQPTRLKELLSISDMVVSYYSLSVLSAAFAKAFHVNIETPTSFFPSEKTQFFFSVKKGSMYNYEGVSRSMSAEQVIRVMSKASSLDFEMSLEKRREYICKYVGVDACNVSQNIFKEIVKK